MKRHRTETMDMRLTETLLCEDRLASLHNANRAMMAAGKRNSKERCHGLGDKYVGHRCICPADDSRLQHCEERQENHLQRGFPWQRASVSIRFPQQQSLSISGPLLHILQDRQISSVRGGQVCGKEKPMQAQASKRHFRSYKIVERI